MIDINEKLTVSELLRIYGDALTPHQAEMLRLYYDCDISLFEIAEQFDISRQAVRDALLRGVKTLKDLDDKLKIKALVDNVRGELTHAVDTLDKGDIAGAKAALNALIDVLEE